MNELLAGTGRCDITPAPGTPQGGWGAQTHQRGTGADMPFLATALALSDGDEAVAILDVDAIGFDREWTDRILQATVDLTGLPRERIRFSCTHTHSGPNTFRLQTIGEGLDMAVSYLDSLPRRIAAAVWQARQNMKRVRVAAGSGTCDINVNRRFRTPEGAVVVGRNWQGAADRTVRVVRFDDLDENPVATIVHYGCHGTTMGWQTQLFTPDFPGMVREVVEREVGGTCCSCRVRRQILRRGAASRAIAGCIGAWVRSWDWRLRASPATSKRFPARSAISGVMPSGAPIALYDDAAIEPPAPVLRVVQRKIHLPAKQFRPPDELEAEAAALRAEMNRLRREGSVDEIRLATAKATQAGWRAENARNYYGMKTIPWELMAIRIGEIALVSVPGEPFTETAQAGGRAIAVPADAVLRILERRVRLHSRARGLQRGWLRNRGHAVFAGRGGGTGCGIGSPVERVG